MEPTANDSAYKRIVRSWAMYDWANSAYFTTVVAAVFPPLFHSMATASGLSDSTATAYWGYLTSAIMLAIALIGPVLGAIADHTGGRKKYIAGITFFASAVTVCFVFLGGERWVLGAALFACATACLAAAGIFYESMLPHIARPGDIDRVSTYGYALGYLGGGTLLVVNALWISKPDWFAMPDTAFAIKASFVSVGIWWAVFTIPLLRNVPDPPADPTPGRGAALAGFVRLGKTLRELGRYKELVKFLGAFWLYNSGIASIIAMATIYGKSIGIGRNDMLGALVITQFIGIPASLAFASLAKRVGTKRMVVFGLAVYAGITVGGFLMQAWWHFYILATVVGLVQGGTQALSRSMFGSMVPRERSSEFFGFMSTSSKFAGIIGPFTFATVTHAIGDSRWGILSLTALFVVGGLLLLFVDEKRGADAART